MISRSDSEGHHSSDRSWVLQVDVGMLVLVPLSTVIINPINPVSKLFYWVPYTYIYIHIHAPLTLPRNHPFRMWFPAIWSPLCFEMNFCRRPRAFFLLWWHDATRWVATVYTMKNAHKSVTDSAIIVIYHVIFGWWTSTPACTPSMTLWLTILLKLYGNNHLSLPVVFH